MVAPTMKRPASDTSSSTAPSRSPSWPNRATWISGLGFTAVCAVKLGRVEWVMAHPGRVGFAATPTAPGGFIPNLTRDYLTSEAGDKLKREIPVGRFGQDGDLDGAVLLL